MIIAASLAVMDIHCCILVWTKKSQLWETFKEVFWNILYLYDNANWMVKLYTQCFYMIIFQFVKYLRYEHSL